MKEITLVALAHVVAAIDARLEKKDRVREEVLVLSRKVVQYASKAIRAVHRQELEEADALLHEADSLVQRIAELTSSYPDILFAGYAQDAQKEYAEAHLTRAFVTGGRLPTPEELGVEDAPYLNALGEAASELRRAILDRIRGGNRLEEAEEWLHTMEEVYSLLQTVDYPHAITNNLRRTTDALRAVLERTRGDVTTAVRQQALQRALVNLERQLRQD
ncbi:MAG: haloacid dehalogenase [Ardenticatenia bacterium]|nr:haloacid dehalogenase [Ardenticatenia bacterium]